MKNLTLCVFITRSSQLWPVILFFMNHIIPCCFMRKFWQTYLNVRTAKQDAGVKIINLQKQLFDVSGKVHRAWRQEDKQTVTRTRKLHIDKHRWGNKGGIMRNWTYWIPGKKCSTKISPEKEKLWIHSRSCASALQPCFKMHNFNCGGKMVCVALFHSFTTAWTA